MHQSLAQVTLVVPDYDEAIEYYTSVLGFELKQNLKLAESKRWVVVQPRGKSGASLLLAQANTEAQSAAIGNQTGGRVFLFLHTDNFERDFNRYRDSGVEFLETPRHEPYGTVAVFKDLFGNKWDLIEPKE